MKQYLFPLGVLVILGISGYPDFLQSALESDTESVSDATPTSSSPSVSEAAPTPSSASAPKVTPSRLPPSHIQPIPKREADVSDDQAVIASVDISAPLPVDYALSAFLNENGRTLQNTDFYTEYVDLNGDDRHEALVLLTDSYWCGMAGCHLAVFEQIDDGYRFISTTTLVHAPVWVSENQTNDWNDLILNMRGGGMPSTDVVLRFDGHAYPSNLSTVEAIAPNTAREIELFSANAAR